jgi:hypothetical protein
MGKGTDMARADAPEHAAMIDNFKDDLLIALVVKAGGKLSISVAEVDAMGGWVLAFAVRDGAFHFEARRKE